MTGIALRRTCFAKAMSLLFVISSLVGPGAEAQVPADQFQAMEWRLVGPFRGGRVTAVAGHPDRPHTFYMGATGGGVWKTTNAGEAWHNVSDGFFNTGTIGAVAVAPSDPDVIYVGTGESPIRGVTTSHGDGVYKSIEGGRSWTHMGLDATRQIAKIRVDPRDADRVYVAAQGNPWGPSEARGLYRSEDGGETWQKTLFVNETTGASFLDLDPNHPHILYAGLWDHQRKPWDVRSGGPGSGLYKSTDHGRTWTALTEGLPDLMGNTAITVSPADSDRLYAMIEAEEGGVFRSDDAGETWQRTYGGPGIRDRGWYYTHIFPHPTDRDMVYVLAAPMVVSVDGGETFREVETPHGDNHDLWINPERPAVMIEGNDGGANVTLDGGKSWSTQFNQPTAQFYRLITDALFPYNLYAGQQDNSTVRIPNRTLTSGGIGQQHWQPVGGGESAHVAFDPTNPDLVYATSLLGKLTEYSTATGEVRDISPYPYFAGFRPARELKYRFNWNAPVLVSQHDPSVIYHGAQMVLRSTDRGQSWTEMGGDLTRNEADKLGTTGGPIMIEGAGGEHYATLMYLAESPHDPEVLWAGSDDGLVHVTRDGGESWTEVTPARMKEGQVNAIEVSPHDPAKAYLAVTRYKLNDFSPIAYRTDDYGRSWTRIVDGLPDADHFVRVVREDPVREGLLFAGTEGGPFVSFNDGGDWQPLQQNLPEVPITDLRVTAQDLVAATQGRAFWVMDDLAALRQITDETLDDDLFLPQPAPALRLNLRRGGAPEPGENPAYGALIRYTLSASAAADAAPLTLTIADDTGTIIRRFASDTELAERRSMVKGVIGQPPAQPLPKKAGQNSYSWTLRVDDMTPVGDTIRYVSNRPYRVAPGSYTLTLSQGGTSVETDLLVAGNPRKSPLSDDAWAQQQALAGRVYAVVDEVHRTANRLRSLGHQGRDQLKLLGDREGAEAVRDRVEALVTAVQGWQSQIPQPPLPEGRQDRIAYPSRLLSTQALHVLAMIDQGPPVAAPLVARVDELEASWAQWRDKAEAIIGGELADLNAALAAAGGGGVVVPAGDQPVARLD